MRMDDVPSVPLRTGLCTSSLPDGLCSVLDVLATILNSPFVLSLLGTAAGACVEIGRASCRERVFALV